MTVVARELPRQWDGPRLLRFLTGLAMLALALMAPLPPVTDAATPSVTVAATSLTGAAAEPATLTGATAESATAANATADTADTAAAPAVRAERSVPIGGGAVAVLIAATAVVVLAGVAHRSRPVRGPPAA